MSRRKFKTVFSDEIAENSDKTFKLKRILIAAIVVLTLAALILLTVFLVKYFGIYHLTVQEGGGVLVNPRTDVTYTIVSPCPYMVNIALDQVYAEADGVQYYKIAYLDENGEEKFFDPKKMIATVDEYRNVDLYLANGFTLPSFDEMNPTLSAIYFVQVQEQRAGTLYADDTKIITTLIKERQSTITPSNVKENSRLNIYLLDPAYPYVWYTVEYFETEDGDMYLRDRSQNKCIKATEELSKMFKSTEAEN